MLRIQAAWAVENKVVINDLKKFVSNTLPRAITTIDDLPCKSEKSKIKQA